MNVHMLNIQTDAGSPVAYQDTRRLMELNGLEALKHKKSIIINCYTSRTYLETYLMNLLKKEMRFLNCWRSDQ